MTPRLVVLLRAGTTIAPWKWWRNALDHGPWLKDALVFLAAAGLVVPLFHRARIGAVLGFLFVGIVVGPYGLGRLADDVSWLRYLTIEDRGRVAPFAELGVLFCCS